MGARIGVIGVGGVGGYFGAKLCGLIAAGEAEVYFAARGEHLQAIRRNGLTVRTAAEGTWLSRPTLATDDFAELPRLDLCLICVKAYDLQPAARRLRHCVSDATTVIPLLNGIDIGERLREEMGEAPVFPGCTYIGSQIASPGTVEQRGGDCAIRFGADPQSPCLRPDPALRLFERSGIACTWFDDVAPELWRKYVFIAAIGIVQASFDETLGQLMESPERVRLLEAVMAEIAALARAQGIALPADIVAANCRRARTFAYATRTSFQRDFERAGRPDERGIFTDTILRLGRRSNTATPVTRELSEILERRKPRAL